MMGQQRHRLASLGIDVWIPKAAPCQKNTASSLWRDQIVVDEIVPSITLSFEVLPSVQAAQANSTPEPQPRGVESAAVELKQQMAIQSVNIEQQSSAPQAINHPNMQGFELQMYVLENCAILIESSQLSTAQQQLWRNIQQAKAGQYAELKWPFPLLEFQESRGLLSYIQGFLNATAIHKKIICLGQFDFMQQVDVVQLASLEDMLAQPLLKRQLWQQMQ